MAEPTRPLPLADGGTATIYPAAESAPLLVLAHGAGAGQTSPFMVAVARGLAERGTTVITFDFPYMAARRKAPDRAPVLEASFLAVIAAASAAHPTHGAVFIGGKSMGGRMATHLLAQPERWPDGTALAGGIVFGYPLNPPGGRASQDRVSHLLALAAPTLVVQGTRDSFGGPSDIAAALAGRPSRLEVHAVEGGDHSLATRRGRGAATGMVADEILARVARWIAAPPRA